MLHPVSPPTPKPAILESSQAANPSLTARSNKSTVQPSVVLQTSAIPAKPTQPEKFPPEFTPEAVSKSAEALGAALTIGYPLQDRIDRSLVFEETQKNEQVTQTITKSRNLLQPQAEVLVEKIAQSSKQKKLKTSLLPLSHQLNNQ